MRVLHVAPLPPLKNGIADYSAALESALRNRGDLEVTSFGDHYPDSDRHAASTLLREYRLLAQTIRSGSFDVIHFESGGSLWKEFLFLFLVSGWANAVTAVTLHDPPVFIDAGYSSRRIVGTEWRPVRGLISYLLVKRMQETIYRRVETVFVFSQLAYNSVFRRFGANDIVLVPLGLPGKSTTIQEAAAATAPALQHDDRFRILVFGFIARGKGLDVFVQAVHELLRTHPCLRSKIVGIICGDVVTQIDSVLREDLNRLVARLGLVDVIQFTGRIPEEAVVPTIRSADVMAVPYDQTGLYSTSASLIRGLWEGAPVVASDARSLPAEVDHLETGLLFEAGNPLDLADKLLWMYRHPERRKEMGARARETATAKHSWTEVCDAIASAYGQALARKMLVRAGSCEHR